ncbi:EAL domain-containing protein [Paenibacillus roseipurpureus]|uniref:EAL domain-containing protein n=1 Tax=Paenibacillus roseopurpureus TaxID=2918901 RepID=A0AA96LVB2_9BACL|nr:EAL domain-containing protein [Paenibacillus sp. MBLB1832]WNR45310.1 EAL domain-containing protein [Paenibacillus sp. MBLB1832]
MSCQGCGMNELLIEIKFEGAHDRFLLRDVSMHMRLRNALHHVEEDTLTIKEFGARELADFCENHLDRETIQFRLPGEDWRPLSELSVLQDTKWVEPLIIERRVYMHFQPIVDMNEQIYAYEALARFMDEEGSLLYPNTVFSAAKTRGRLYALDRLCRMKAVEEAVPLRAKTFINFIPTSIYSPEFCLKSTIELAAKLNADPSLFVFEVVETEKTEDLAHLKRILAFYKEKGFQYALDDVGEGFSSLEVLTELKPNYMKLDRVYVHGVSRDSAKQLTAELFLEAALRIGSIPLAEGIESREDFEWLKQRGYQLFQGYLFGKPSLPPIPRQEERAWNL